tara:strand:- start:278 stop:1639 length:1362 start_codon:yes stop_codon:yes gene_type:complete
MAHKPGHRKIGNPWYGFKHPDEYDEDKTSDRERAALALRYQNEVGWPTYADETFGLFNTPGNIPFKVEDRRRKDLLELLYNAQKMGMYPEGTPLSDYDPEEMKKQRFEKTFPLAAQTKKYWGDALTEAGGVKQIALDTLNQFRPKKDAEPTATPKTDATSSSTDTSASLTGLPTIEITQFSPESVKKEDHLKSIWGKYADDPKARKEAYLKQLNNIYAKSMLLDGWASMTGGESRGPAYASAANDLLEKTAKFDSEIRLHDIWKAAMFRDGEYFPAKTQADLYERLKAIGARPDEIEYFMKGFGGKEFRHQKEFDEGYKAINVFDTETGDTYTVDANSPKTKHMFKTRRWIESTKESGSSYSGKKFTGKLSVLSKRFKGSDNVEVKRQAIADAVALIQQQLLSDSDRMIRMGWAQVFPDEVEALDQPNGVENLARKMMGISLPSGQTGTTLDN